MSRDGISLLPGDLLRIQRRYLVDGVPTAVTDEGRFAGVEQVGTTEHIALKDSVTGGLRLFPLASVSEITLVKAARRKAKKASPAPAAAWDPGFR